MKRLISILLVISLVFSMPACAEKTTDDTAEVAEDSTTVESAAEPSEESELTTEAPIAASEETAPSEADKASGEVTETVEEETVPEFAGINDPELLSYVEGTVYNGLLSEFGDQEYYVADVETAYVSSEYIEELEYNSRSNIFFGYTLEELDEQFQGTRYVFTLGDNGATDVQPFEDYDDSYERALKNVAIGAGVILVCVTVVVATNGVAGFEAVNMIFAMGAKTGAEMGLGAGVIGGLSEALITGIKTGDWDQALKNGALKGSEAFKLWTIIGTTIGAGAEYIGLLDATLNGLTIREAAAIQKATNLPLDFIKNFHSMSEFKIYEDAGLVALKMGGKWGFLRDIDLTSVVDSQGRTNVQRIIDGLSPLDPNGVAYELHHIGQKIYAPLAILTKAEHIQGGNNKILHYLTESAVEHGATWATQVHEFWITYLAYCGVVV